MFVKDMQPVITKAMKNNVINLHTYLGYAGANILKLTFSDIQSMLVIRDYTRSLGHTTTVKLANPIELFCIFEQPSNVYGLKKESA